MTLQFNLNRRDAAQGRAILMLPADAALWRVPRASLLLQAQLLEDVDHLVLEDGLGERFDHIPSRA